MKFCFTTNLLLLATCIMNLGICSFMNCPRFQCNDSLVRENHCATFDSDKQIVYLSNKKCSRGNCYGKPLFKGIFDIPCGSKNKKGPNQEKRSLSTSKQDIEEGEQLFNQWVQDCIDKFPQVEEKICAQNLKLQQQEEDPSKNQ